MEASLSRDLLMLRGDKSQPSFLVSDYSQAHMHKQKMAGVKPIVQITRGLKP